MLAGLLQQYSLAGSHKALEIAEALGEYIGKRVRRLAAEKGLAHQFKTLNQECGGINEALSDVATGMAARGRRLPLSPPPQALWHLASLTGKAEHRATASLFDKPCLLGPLAAGQDALTGMHGESRLHGLSHSQLHGVSLCELPVNSQATRPSL